MQRFMGGRSLSVWRGLVGTAVVGLLVGFSSGVLILLFMVVKTGLHAHGPEFTPSEINWVIQQLPLWSLIGLLAGLGVGFLMAATADQAS